MCGALPGACLPEQLLRRLVVRENKLSTEERERDEELSKTARGIEKMLGNKENGKVVMERSEQGYFEEKGEERGDFGENEEERAGMMKKGGERGGKGREEEM